MGLGSKQQPTAERCPTSSLAWFEKPRPHWPCWAPTRPSVWDRAGQAPRLQIMMPPRRPRRRAHQLRWLRVNCSEHKGPCNLDQKALPSQRSLNCSTSRCPGVSRVRSTASGAMRSVCWSRLTHWLMCVA